MRRPLIAGNWKMHKTVQESVSLAMDLKKSLADVSSRDILIAPTSPALFSVAEKLKQTGIMVGAQNIYPANEGAFTGEISGPMAKAAGAEAVLIGHSERRQLFGETDDMVNAKVRAALGAGLTPIICLGETLQAREAGNTFSVVGSQLAAALDGVSNEHATQLVIAYEPIWAIGTGKTATPEMAQEVHLFLRTELGKMYRSYVPAAARLIYGGSVKPSNVDSLMAQPDVDGALVGGASLNAKDFSRIVHFE